ncbi:type II toxin-antitoxin system HicB family antitoxin [Xenorhabdus griffiniae]|uniref:Antitoxin n=3 Tax=Xenorhabdus TaxID=626 RepID=A0A1Q5THK8_9GAMM|nr:type II toxin-antitoxin system HicB family antitoxin [Xenorhabdus griffiniae]OKO99714.1 antitoxin [Xenorhabdus eapokensis]WMV73611.1 type II toxin-antitoxin system HicB family antitoxin [Xenorhabdus griffiniae]WNH03291.1 type II toxin-antitoxin system HicB family antitoxin [Xenorhabdus griffiniae]
MIMRYPVNIEEDGTNLFVSFPDIPEALTCGDDLADAKAMGYDALLTAFSMYFDDESKEIPLPGDTVTEHYIDIPASVAAKILLLNAMVRSGVSRSELGRRVGIQKQNVKQLLDVYHATKIDTVEKALSSLGYELILTAA